MIERNPLTVVLPNQSAPMLAESLWMERVGAHTHVVTHLRDAIHGSPALVVHGVAIIASVRAAVVDGMDFYTTIPSRCLMYFRNDFSTCEITRPLQEPSTGLPAQISPMTDLAMIEIGASGAVTACCKRLGT